MCLIFLFQVKADEYGEIIKAADYNIADPVEPNEAMETEEDKDADESSTDPLTEVATKCIASTITLDINAKVQFIDFEGRSDGKSIKKYLSQIRPKQLILVHGTEEATRSLGEYCQKGGFVERNVYCPNIGDVIDATTERHIYQVRLRDQLVSSLTFERAGDMELAWVDGQLEMPEVEEETEVEMQDDGDLDASKSHKTNLNTNPPTLESLSANSGPGHSSVYINEPKLSDFKSVLINEGVQCEFSGGVLICNNQVAVRREAGRMKLEGTLCKDYFKVRQLLYKQYAIV